MRLTGRQTAMTMIVAALAWSGSARAGSDVAPRRLEVVVLGSAAARAVLTSAIAPLLPSAAAVSWQEDNAGAARDVPPSLTAAGEQRLWIDARPTAAIVIVAFSRQAAAPHVRVVAAPELTPVVAEDVAQIARESATVLIAEAEATPPKQAPFQAPPAPPPAAPPTVIAGVAPEESVSHQPSDFLFTASLLVRNEYGFDFNHGYGAALSVAWSFRPSAGSSSLRPFTSLTAGYFEQQEFGHYAGEIAQVVGLAWHPWSLLHLSVGGGAGVERAKIFGTTTDVIFGRAAFGAAVLLPAGFEETLTVTLDAGQIPTTGHLSPNWLHPGLLVGIGWRPGS